MLLWKNLDWRLFPKERNKIIRIWEKYGRGTTWNHSKISSSGTTLKMLFLPLKLYKKGCSFVARKELTCWRLSFTVPNLANRTFHSSTSLKFFPFNQEGKSFDDYIRECLTGGPSIVFTRYAKVGSSRIKEVSICVKLKLVSTPVGSIHSQSWNICQQESTQNRSCVKTQDSFIIGARKTIWNASFWSTLRSRNQIVIFRLSSIKNHKNESV